MSSKVDEQPTMIEGRTESIRSTVTESLKDALEDGAVEHDISESEIIRQGIIAWLVEFTDHDLEDF